MSTKYIFLNQRDFSHTMSTGKQQFKRLVRYKAKLQNSYIVKKSEQHEPYKH